MLAGCSSNAGATPVGGTGFGNVSRIHDRGVHKAHHQKKSVTLHHYRSKAAGPHRAPATHHKTNGGRQSTHAKSGKTGGSPASKAGKS
jgi:hypothetical protein